MVKNISKERTFEAPFHSTSKVLTLIINRKDYSENDCFAHRNIREHLNSEDYWCFLLDTVITCKITTDRRNIKYHCHFRSEGLPAAFHKFSRISKIWVFRPRSLTSYLPYPPFVRSVGSARKTVLPTKKLKRASQKGKN